MRPNPVSCPTKVLGIIALPAETLQLPRIAVYFDYSGVGGE